MDKLLTHHNLVFESDRYFVRGRKIASGRLESEGNPPRYVVRPLAGTQVADGILYAAFISEVNGANPNDAAEVELTNDVVKIPDIRQTVLRARRGELAPDEEDRSGVERAVANIVFAERFDMTPERQQVIGNAALYLCQNQRIS